MAHTVLQSDVSNSTTSSADVTGLSFPVASGRTYKFRFVAEVASAATTTGVGLGVNGPTVTRITYRSHIPTTASTDTIAHVTGTTLDSYTASTDVASTTGNLCLLEGIVTPSADGTMILRFKSEVGASAVTVKAGSFVEWRLLK